MHYTVVDAGGPNNVVPKTASGSFSLRSYNSSYLKSVVSRFKYIVKGAALMTGTTYEIIRERDLDSKVPVYSLNDVVMNNAKLINAPNIKPAREKTGSSDFGNVMYVIPGSCIRNSFVDENVSSHSQEFLEDGKSERGNEAVINAAKILAGTAFDLIDEPDLMLEVKREFNDTKAKMSLA
jgi:metal-dependent amidase/aminoacylase/carboxypeptidase family protein